MRSIPAPVAPLVAQLVLFGALLWATGVEAAGVLVAGTCALAGWVVLVRALADHGRRSLGPADLVTVTRGTLACVVAALTVDTARTSAPTTSLVLLAAVALSLDAVDGWVARRTRTVSALGARMDMEVDAFLILVLSVAAASALGWWVLAIGAFRYAFAVATWAAPWLGGAVPPRYWRKAVAALQGIALTVGAAQVLPPTIVDATVIVALALLGWSFGTQGVELWSARASRVWGPGEGRTSALQPAPATDGEPGPQPVAVLP